jgi:hypothetical protein
MATFSLGSVVANIRRIINSSVKESIPRKYKRTALITSLIYIFDESPRLSRVTFKKIVRLFEMGINDERNLRYTYYIRNYIWSDLITNGVIEINGKSMKISEFMETYRSSQETPSVSVTTALIEAIFAKVPEFIKYGSEQLVRHDINNVLFFIRHKNQIRA